jgi:hypothetical protein
VSQPLSQLRRRGAAPGALLVGAFVFLAIAGVGRAWMGTTAARQSRYAHLTVGMALPAIALAADALVRRWRALLPAVLVLFLVGIPGNIKAIIPTGLALYTRGNRDLTMAIATSPYLAQVPRSLEPSPDYLLGVTAGWLRNGVRSGRIPKKASLMPDNVALATLSIVLDQTHGRVSTARCTTITHAVTMRVERGDLFTFSRGALAAHVRLPDGRLSSPRTLAPTEGTTVRVVAGPVMLTLSRSAAARPPVLCGAS